MGRPKAKNVIRDKSGKVRGEPEAAVKSVAWAYRAKDVPAKYVNDPLAGFTLGRLKLAKLIDQDEFNAGEDFAKLIRRHAYVHGYQIDRLVSPGFEMVSYGVACGDDLSEEAIANTKSAFKAAYSTLVSLGIRIATTTYDICLERIPAGSITEVDLTDLGKGLRALSKQNKR